MGTVTALEPQKGRKGRVNVFIDGEFRVGLSLELALKNGLRVGEKVDPAKLEKLVRENELDRILEKVYRFLSHRPRSHREIEDYLAGRKVGPILVDLVIETLKRQNYLDDEEFSRWWIEQRVEFRPKGKFGLRSELSKKGVDREIIERALDSQLAGFGSKDLALKAARKKQSGYQGLSRQEFRRKMGAFLARRGFDWETIRAALAEMESWVSPEQGK